MNDKCASGTGATIDKCFIKVGMPRRGAGHAAVGLRQAAPRRRQMRRLRRDRHRQPGQVGHPADEIMCSLADAIVMQNLSVLTRGNTLQPRVLLLGGPNTYLPFLQRLLAAAHPRDLGGARLSNSRATCRSRSSSSCRPTPSTTPRSGRHVRDARSVDASAAIAVRRRCARRSAERRVQPGRASLRAAAGRERRGARRGSSNTIAMPLQSRGVRAGPDRARTSSASTAARRRRKRYCSTKPARSSSRQYQLSQGQPDRRHEGDTRRRSAGAS